MCGTKAGCDVSRRATRLLGRAAAAAVKIGLCVLMVVAWALARRAAQPDAWLPENERVHVAIGEGDGRRLADLLEDGRLLEIRDGTGFTPLMSAAQAGRADLARQLLARGADANAEAQFGWTALMGAACGEHEEIVRTLLRAGARVDATSAAGNTALFVAAIHGNEAVARALLEADADPDGSADALGGRRVPVVAAAANGDVLMLRLLLSAGATPDLPDGDGLTAMAAAQAAGHAAAVAELGGALADATVAGR